VPSDHRGNEGVSAIVENAEGRPISSITMAASCPSHISKFRLTLAAVVGCATCAVGSLAFAQAAPPQATQMQTDKGALASSPKSPSTPSTNLNDLYFGPPVMPPSHIWRAEEPPAKVARAQQLKAKRPLARHVRVQHRTRNMIATAPAPRAKPKRTTIAMYREAVRSEATAFGDERSFRWRKCIPGIQMPLVCYLPATDRARVVVHPTD
jgi:hypothetical protein